MDRHNLFVIITGTDPESRKGGIGFAMPGYLAALRSKGITYESIPTYHPATKGGKWWLLLTALPKLVTQILTTKKKIHPVVVYSHAGAGISLLREGAVLHVARLFGAKTALQLHSIDIDGYLRNRLKSRLFKMVISGADTLCVLTPWWKKLLKQSGIKKNIAIIPNPLTPTWEQKAIDAEKFDKDAGELTVLSMTRIEPGKGVDLIVDAMQFVPDGVHLVIAGDGKQLESLKIRANDHGLTEKIHFTGWVTGDKKQQLLESTDIFCLPTTYDSFGMGFLEAMANGIPVIALDWGPISDVISDKRSGLLVKQADAQLLADAIEAMMDDTQRKRMGNEARKWVLEQFSSDIVGNKIRNMMDCLAGKQQFQNDSQ